MKRSTKVVLTMLGSVAATIAANGCSGCVGTKGSAQQIQSSEGIYQGRDGRYYPTYVGGHGFIPVGGGGGAAQGSLGPSGRMGVSEGGVGAPSSGGISRGGFGGAGHASAGAGE